MNNLLLSIFLIVTTNLAYSQQAYRIDGFSEKYYGKLVIGEDQVDAVFVEGDLLLFGKNNTKLILKIHSEEFTFDINDEGAVKTNVHSLPYGEQSIIIAEDFDFDGQKDLAIMDGQNSCYHGPSFRIYLQRDSLVFSPEFTRLAQEYCGLFQINSADKLISTMTKSGCCWHEFSEFKVVEGVPQPISVVVQDATEMPFIKSIFTVWKDNKKLETITMSLDMEDLDILFSFELTKTKKKVLFFKLDGDLVYTLMAPDETVELYFPNRAEEENAEGDQVTMRLNHNKTKLTFKNKNAIYQIYESRKENQINAVGVLVKVNGKKYNLNGTVKTVVGSLKNITDLKVSNLISE